MSTLRWAGWCHVSDEENLGEQLLDLLIYAPIGLLLEAKDLIPKLAERGRGQVALTQLAGKVAGNRGRDETAPLFRRLVEAAGAALGSMTTDEHELSDELELSDEHELSDELDDHGESSEDDLSLPIKNYNAFSAPQLLEKLEALDQQQLDEILDYELTHRDRQTVTNRIKQLSALDHSPNSLSD